MFWVNELQAAGTNSNLEQTSDLQLRERRAGGPGQGLNCPSALTLPGRTQKSTMTMSH